MSLATDRTAGIDLWTGRLLAIGGALILAETITELSGGSLRGIPFSWLLTSIPFGIGFAVIPLVLLRSYQYLADRTPRSAVVGATFVAALPVGTVGIVAWALLGQTSGFVPEVDVLPVTIDTVFFTLLATFAVGTATFGLAFVRHGETRSLGGSLLLFASAWIAPLTVVTLSGVYPSWLGDFLVVSVATTMIAIGYFFPPNKYESRR